MKSLSLTLDGGVGVDLFFVISGFIMTHVTRDGAMTAPVFMAHRGARIVPIYWIMTLLVFVSAALAPSLFRYTDAEPSLLVKSLLFIPYVKASGLMEPVLFVGWTLNYEMVFYGLFAIGLLVPARAAGLLGVIGVLLILAAAGTLAPAQPAPLAFYTDPIILEFGLGILVGLVTERLPAASGLPVRGLVLGLLAAGFAALLALAVPTPGVPRVASGGLPASIVVASAVQLEKSGWSLRWRLPLLLGDASYAIYLSHPYVTQAIVKLYERLPAGKPAALVLLLAALGCVCLVGILLHRFVERPASRWARRRVDRMLRREGAAAKSLA